MTNNSHSAIGPSLGYYYQAIFALICLFDSKYDNAFVSIETLDDVYHNDNNQETLHQLKHKTVTNPSISIKDDDLWKTLKVWCDFATVNDPNDGIFTLSTVAKISVNDPLNVLKNTTESRDYLENLLLEEATRVNQARKEAFDDNLIRIQNNQKEEKLPFESKYKGCEAFVNLDPIKRKVLLKNARINSEVFSIDKAQEEVIKRIRNFTQQENYIILSESIIAWWDREAVKSLTRERGDCIFLSELQEFIARKNAELYHDGFTDDIDDLELPAPEITHPIHVKQLEIIDASQSQIKRSFNTEVKARIQRKIWMENKFPAAAKLQKYDKLLIEEWDYKFGEILETANQISEDQKKAEGRKLLDWSHDTAHNQVKPISKHYNNPDLVRGSYQILSKAMNIGWHCDYNSLIQISNENE